MIRALVLLDSEARLSSVEASGHAGGAATGENIACAAFTVLVRTAWESLAAYPSLDVRGRADKPGELAFQVQRRTDEDSGRHRGISDFLLTGLTGLSREFPGQFEIQIR